MVVGAVGTGIEERKEYLGHLGEVLVREATEEERAGLVLGELGNGGAEGPGTGRIVGDVEEEIGWEEGWTYKFKAIAKEGGALPDALIDGRMLSVPFNAPSASVEISVVDGLHVLSAPMQVSRT